MMSNTVICTQFLLRGLVKSFSAKNYLKLSGLFKTSDYLNLLVLFADYTLFTYRYLVVVVIYIV